MNCKRCDKPIDQHEAGSETDACIAVVLMGSKRPVYAHSVPHIRPYYTDDGFWVCHPEYEKGDKCEWKAIPFSTSIADAWKVVEKIRKKHILLPIWDLAFLGDFPLRVCQAALKCHLSNS